MKKLMFFVAGAAVMAGCHPGVTVATGPNGEKMVVNQGTNGGVTFDDGKGHTESVGPTNVSEADLGVPYYPASSQMDNGNLKSDMADATSCMNMRTTSDGPQKVVDFYKDALTKAGYTVAGSMVSDEFATVKGTKGTDDADTVAVIFAHDKDKNQNTVTVTHNVKKATAASPSPSAS